MLNSVRDWRIYADLATVPDPTRLESCMSANPLGVELEQTIYALILPPLICA